MKNSEQLCFSQLAVRNLVNFLLNKDCYHHIKIIRCWEIIHVVGMIARGISQLYIVNATRVICFFLYLLDYKFK